MKNIKSFTLAEVLITLVIIGIIAAITVPMIMANHKRIETASKVKKFYAMITNAIKLAEVEHGVPYGDWDDYSGSRYEEYFDRYLKKHLSYIEAETGSHAYNETTGEYGSVDWGPGEFSIYLSDGTIMGLSGGDSSLILFDVNGEKGPNKDGRDIFEFDTKSSSDGSFKVCNYQHTRDELISSCSSQTDAISCTCLLMNDGWEFKNDYPLKL